jgi:hypothetical protein
MTGGYVPDAKRPMTADEARAELEGWRVVHGGVR